MSPEMVATVRKLRFMSAFSANHSSVHFPNLSEQTETWGPSPLQAPDEGRVICPQIKRRKAAIQVVC